MVLSLEKLRLFYPGRIISATKKGLFQSHKCHSEREVPEKRIQRGKREVPMPGCTSGHQACENRGVWDVVGHKTGRSSKRIKGKKVKYPRAPSKCFLSLLDRAARAGKQQ